MSFNSQTEPNTEESDIAANSHKTPLQSFRILGIPVSIINKSSALLAIDEWITEKKGGYICVRDAHGIISAQQNPRLQEIHERALMVTPDGVPLVWFAKLYGHASVERVCGPDLMEWLCAYPAERGYRHYFFGGAEGVATALAERLKRRRADLVVVGVESPPFRPLSDEPDMEACARIAATKPDIVWVGLGSPKQEYWVAANAPHIRDAILIGVGAAFDFHAGHIRRAPRWMQRVGLEWLFRLVQEPRRLWRRYLVMAPRFLVLAGGEWLRLRKPLAGDGRA